MIYKRIFFSMIILSSFVLAQKPEEIILKEGLALKFFNVNQRNMFTPDPVEYEIVNGDWSTPSEGDSVLFGSIVSKWSKVKVNNDGWFEGADIRTGYLSIVYNSQKRQKVLLAGLGNSMVYVNGQLHYGNVYGRKENYELWESRFDYSLIPIELKKGNNEFLFVTSGKMKAKLIETGDGIFFNTKDVTLPDLIIGQDYDGYGSVVLINNTDKPLSNVHIVTSTDSGQKDDTSLTWGVIQPMSFRKIPIRVFYKNPDAKGIKEIKISVIENKTEKVLAEAVLNIRVVDKSDNHKVTFFSKVDHSIQYYSINPAQKDDGKPKALFLSLHGASGEALYQSGIYYPKTWGHIVSPTNRRPYGFNWEDWGRIDAMEVYEQALNTLNIDSSRIYLTGHSMGGHGVWHLGALYPDKFAAIGPSSGWISYSSYGSRKKNDNPTPMESIILRAANSSDTYGLSGNYKQEGVYILHGEKDDNVPPTESRNMVENLKKFHNDFVYYEQPGAKHSWALSNDVESNCVDWQPLFDFFARHSLPKNKMIREIKFTTSNPEISSKDHWLVVVSQIEQQKLSKVDFRFDPGKNRFIGSTENVFQFGIICNMADLNKPLNLEIDNQSFTVDPDHLFTFKRDWDGYIFARENMIDKGLLFEKRDGKWGVINSINQNDKGPGRYGTFKSVINNNIVIIFGTKGNKEENEWAFNKARYDAEQFWYLGNGSVQVLSDIEFEKSRSQIGNVLIYGNAETNSAWKRFLKDSPVQVTKGKIQIGKKEYKGKDLACIFVRPIENMTGSVGVISGSGIAGMKLNDRKLYMQPGYAFPDFMLFDGSTLTKGIDGVLAAGFFGLDWSVDKGEIIYKNQ